MRKKLTNKDKVLRFIRSNPNAKASDVAFATHVPVNSVYQIMHKAKKEAGVKPSIPMADIVFKIPRGRGTEPKADAVNHPAHYKVGGIETIDYIEAKKLNYNLGNVVKYISRSDYKGRSLEDLKKGMWYLKREIESMEKCG